MNTRSGFLGSGGSGERNGNLSWLARGAPGGFTSLGCITFHGILMPDDDEQHHDKHGDDLNLSRGRSGTFVPRGSFRFDRWARSQFHLSCRPRFTVSPATLLPCWFRVLALPRMNAPNFRFAFGYDWWLVFAHHVQVNSRETAYDWTRWMKQVYSRLDLVFEL